MKTLLSFLITLLVISGCTENPINAQPSGERVGGRCEGCEAIYENPVPFKVLDWQLTLPDYNDQGPKLHITGKVYKPDGTPAEDVIIYVYHTDQKGVYPTKGDEKGWGKRHGYIRGWLKTNEKGEYSIKTLKPASYPNFKAAAHIHCLVKEDKINEYFIGDFLFEGDPNLTEEEKTSSTIPAGSGLLKLMEKDGILFAKRDLYLGKNVRNYPKKK